jgi:hypothetical protein
MVPTLRDVWILGVLVALPAGCDSADGSEGSSSGQSSGQVESTADGEESSGSTGTTTAASTTGTPGSGTGSEGSTSSPGNDTTASGGNSAGDTGPLPPAVTRYAGEITEWPVIIDAPEVTVDNLPLAQVYFSRDGGRSWWANHTRCQGGWYGQRFRDGQISLHETYCTQDVTHYQVVLQEAEATVSGTADANEPWLSLDNPLGDLAAPPLATIYSSADGEEWVFDHGTCGRVETFELHEDGLRSYTTYCTEDRPFRQVALGTPASRTDGPFKGSAAVLLAELSLGELPFATLWIGKGQGMAFESTYDCGLEAHTLELYGEGAWLNRNFCSEFAERFVFSVGAD